MSILTWLVFGLIVGIVAKLLMPGRDPGGFIITNAVGYLGRADRRVSWSRGGLVPGRRSGWLRHGGGGIDRAARPLSSGRRETAGLTAGGRLQPIVISGAPQSLLASYHHDHLLPLAP